MECIDKAILLEAESTAWFGFQRAHILFSLSRFTDALTQCEELKDATVDPNVWFLLGKCLKKVGRVDEAREAFGNANEVGVVVGGMRGVSVIKSAMERVGDGLDVGGDEEFFRD